jgi:hypothetical protein
MTDNSQKKILEQIASFEQRLKKLEIQIDSTEDHKEQRRLINVHADFAKTIGNLYTALARIRCSELEKEKALIEQNQPTPKTVKTTREQILEMLKSSKSTLVKEAEPYEPEVEPIEELEIDEPEKPKETILGSKKYTKENDPAILRKLYGVY